MEMMGPSGSFERGMIVRDMDIVKSFSVEF